MADELGILVPWEDDHDRAQPATRYPLPLAPCRHAGVRLAPAARRVYCRSCGEEVDAYTVLERMSGDWDRIVSWRREAERLRAAAAERLKETLRLEENARARVRRRDPEAKLPARPGNYGMPI